MARARLFEAPPPEMMSVLRIILEERIAYEAGIAERLEKGRTNVRVQLGRLVKLGLVARVAPETSEARAASSPRILHAVTELGAAEHRAARERIELLAQAGIALQDHPRPPPPGMIEILEVMIDHGVTYAEGIARVLGRDGDRVRPQLRRMSARGLIAADLERAGPLENRGSPPAYHLLTPLGAAEHRAARLRAELLSVVHAAQPRANEDDRPSRLIAWELILASRR